ncbi:trypsin-like serine protease [Fulvivirga kasyanovii]
MTRLLLTILFSSILSSAGFAQRVNLGDRVEGKPRIVGGTQVDISKRPWQVALINKSNGAQFCGGTIIDEYWIVSANHCVEWTTAEAIQVLAGSTDKTDLAGGQLIDVAEVIMYPGYVSAEEGYDLTLLRLAKPLDLSGPKAQKVGYITKTDEANGLINEGVIATVSGWGTLESGGNSSDVLMSVDVPIVTNETANSLEYNGAITETMLAAGDTKEGGVDACQGDSGGPLVVPNADGTGYLLAGATSWGEGCAKATAPGIYARVSYFAGWIAETSGVVNNKYEGLFISEIVEGNETGDLPKYVEIYNASEKSYNLNNVAIKVYTDAKPEAPVTISLSGVTLAPEASYVISQTAFEVAWGSDFSSEIPDLINATLDFDGNDVVRLVETVEGYTIDQYGVTGADVTAEFFWDYTNSIVTRKSFVRESNSGGFLESSFAKWEVKAYSASGATPGSHVSEVPANDVTLGSIANISNNEELAICGTDYTVTPEVSIRNSSASEITSLKLSFASDLGTTPIVYDLSSSPLAVGGSTKLSGPTIDFGDLGSHSISVEVVSVNDELDGNPTNSEPLEVDFSLIQGYQMTFSMVFDSESGDNGFFIADEQLEIIYSGNGGESFDGYKSGEIYKETICLPAGFYFFVFADVEPNPNGPGGVPGEGLKDPGEATFTINAESGDFEVAKVSGLFSEGWLPFGFKLPYENITDASVEIMSPVVGDYKMRCDVKQPVTVQVKNVNSLTINQFSLRYGLSGAATLTYDYSGEPLRSGAVSTVVLDDFPFVEGNNSFEVNIASVNGSGDTDVNTTNNSSSESFEMLLPTDQEQLTLQVKLDKDPEEVSWEVVNDSDKVVASGAFEEGHTNTVKEEVLCLAEGTYTFRLLDDVGDGGAVATGVDANGKQVFSVGPHFSDQTEIKFTLPYVAQPDASIAVLSPGSGEELSLCQASPGVTALIQVTNEGNTPVTALEIAYGFGSLDHSSSIDGLNIEVGKTLDLAVEVPVSAGSDTLIFQIVTVNGVADKSESGNTAKAGVNVTMDNSLNSLRVEIRTDEYPDDFSYQILDGNGTVVITSPKYSYALSTIMEDYCLADGNYTFKIADKFGDGGTTVILTNGNSEVVLGKAEGGSYTSEVEITFCFGCGEVKAPFNLVAEGTVSGVALTWEEKADNEEGFRVERSLDQEKWEVIATVGANTVTYTDKVSKSGTYYYRVEAFKASEASGYSNVVKVMADAVMGLDDKLVTHNIYPNPVEQGSVLTVKTPKNNVESVSVINVMGITLNTSVQKTQDRFMVNTDKLPVGVYQLIIKQTDGRVSLQRFIVK